MPFTSYPFVDITVGSSTDPATIVTANSHGAFCSRKVIILGSARGYHSIKIVFKSNELGVVLKTEDVNDYSNFTEFYFT
jgi:hypothetical protein